MVNLSRGRKRHQCLHLSQEDCDFHFESTFFGIRLAQLQATSLGRQAAESQGNAPAQALYMLMSEKEKYGMRAMIGRCDLADE